MKKIIKNPGLPPVSKRQMATYLAISPAMMSLSDRSQRNMHGNTSRKHTDLFVSFTNQSNIERKGRSWKGIKIIEDDTCNRMISKLSSEIPWLNSKADQLRSKLDAMKKACKHDCQWLNTIDERIGALHGRRKETERDWVWLNNQHALTTKRLEKNGFTAQLKLEFEIELLNAKAMISKKMLAKLKKLL